MYQHVQVVLAGYIALHHEHYRDCVFHINIAPCLLSSICHMFHFCYSPVPFLPSFFSSRDTEPLGSCIYLS